MSFRGIQWAFDTIQHHKLGQAAALVACYLGHAHNQETGRCDPSMNRIAEKTNLSRRTVIRAISQIEKVGRLSTMKRTYRTGRGKRNMNNRYKLLGSGYLAHGRGAICHSNMKENTAPSAFDDLALLIDDGSEE
ncbi:hypothetical protein ROJ8625_04108 [Roseivivax jejudonensis]|uniref:Helix-turn-helix domain-containing protein n=1 Tax=Roseivivax jejudonensis TaxID=1529041 RepID=A0A1X7ADF4_9RHOB|nr:helix-turn-helix domain-containing protein [Roseivivax jejudonensis]SLN74824.1 hypothetical protein ROJ8625_04108 [Roseivivax jejudonensis]